MTHGQSVLLNYKPMGDVPYISSEQGGGRIMLIYEYASVLASITVWDFSDKRILPMPVTKSYYQPPWLNDCQVLFSAGNESYYLRQITLTVFASVNHMPNLSLWHITHWITSIQGLAIWLSHRIHWKLSQGKQRLKTSVIKSGIF